MFGNKAEKTYTNTINMLIDANKMRSDNNKVLIDDLYDKVNYLTQELDRRIRIETNIDVKYGVHWTQYPIKELMTKLLKTLGYRIEYNKPNEDLFKLKKIKKGGE